MQISHRQSEQSSHEKFSDYLILRNVFVYCAKEEKLSAGFSDRLYLIRMLDKKPN